MTPCVVYARVSTEEQARTGYSIKAQQKDIGPFVMAHHLTLVEQFTEAESAKQSGRREFNRMLSYLIEHPQVRTVVVHKFDRLSRNFEDVNTLRQLGCRILSVREPADESPGGRLQQNLAFSIAAYYSDNLSAEVKKGLREKFEAGGYNSKAPVGYLNIPRTKTRKAYIAVDPEKAPLVQRLFTRYATGNISLRDLSNEVYEYGLRSRTGNRISEENIKRKMENPFYIGLTSYGGVTKRGVHEPLIAPRLFERVQRVLRQRARDHGDKGAKFFLLRSMLFCGHCGRKMTAEEKPRGSYYRCRPDDKGRNCIAPYIPVYQLDEKVIHLLPSIELTPKGHEQVLAALQQLEKEREALKKKEQHSLLTRRAALEKKLSRLTDGFAEGVIGHGQYHHAREGIETDLFRIEERLQFFTSDLRDDIAAIERLLTTASSVARMYALATTDQVRKEHLKQVFRRIEVTNKEITNIEYNPPFHLLLGRPTDSPVGKKLSETSLEQELLNHIEEHR